MSDSNSDTSSSDDEDFPSSFKNLRRELRKVDHELEVSIEKLRDIRKVVKHTKKYTQPPDLSSEYPLLHKYLNLWKKEKRMNHNGSKVFLNKEEAEKFRLKEGWNSTYEICKIFGQIGN